MVKKSLLQKSSAPAKAWPTGRRLIVEDHLISYVSTIVLEQLGVQTYKPRLAKNIQKRVIAQIAQISKM